MTPPMNLAALVDLLCALFDTAEDLRAFLRRREDGVILISWLPGPAISLRKFAGETVELLERSGNCDRRFFRELADAFASKARVIWRVAGTLGLASAPMSGDHDDPRRPGTVAPHASKAVAVFGTRDDASLRSLFDLDR